MTRRGTTCPVGRRPVPYGYSGKCTSAGCYIKPNPQGQPCCYAEPKKLDYSRDKVQELYKKAGIQIPDSVKKLFGITSQNRAVEVASKVPELKLNGNKIDSRQCLRYTKVALVDIARRLRLTLPTKVTKPILCALIKGHRKMPAGLLANIVKGKRLVSVKRQQAAIRIQKAFRARMRRPKAPVVVAPRAVTKATGGAARIKPTRRRAPVVAPKQVFTNIVVKKPTRRTRENIYRQLNNMYSRGEYANVNNFNYANQNIVEKYYTNKATKS